MQITLFRRNTPGAHSIENVTEDIKANLPQDAKVELFVPSVANQGFFKNFIAGLQAMNHQSDVNHITGHIHYIAFFLDPKRTIITMHDCERLMSSDWRPIKKKIFKILNFKLPSIYCRFVTTVSEESKKNLIKYGGIPANRIRVIPLGVRKCFIPLGLEKMESRALLKNPSGKKTVLHISHMNTHKNISKLLEALKGLDIKLIRIGLLNDRHREILAKNNTDYIQFHDISSDLLLRIYNSADCLVLPSIVEGFGLPIIEAQACGCPVVTSNISSMPDVAGKGAVLVDPYSADSIREGIEKILNNHDFRTELIQAGLENVRRFEWKRIAKLYYEIYEEIALKDAI